MKPVKYDPTVHELMIYTCEDCGLHGLTLKEEYEFPPAGWHETSELLDHHGKSEYTGKFYCPQCREGVE